MFILNLKVTGAEGQVSLIFKERATAEAAVDGIMEEEEQHIMGRVVDDHGQSFALRPRDLLYAHIVDVPAHAAVMRRMQAGMTGLRTVQ